MHSLTFSRWQERPVTLLLVLAFMSLAASGCKNPFTKEEEASNSSAPTPAATETPSPTPSESPSPTETHAALGTVTTITRGDILYGAERDSNTSDGALPNAGGIHAISSNGIYKGVAIARNAASDVFRAIWGLRISWDSLNYVWKLEAGTINSSLAGEIRTFSSNIDASTTNTYTLTAPTLATNTTSTATDYFAFGWTGAASGNRYLVDVDSNTGAPKLRYYSNGSTADTCEIAWDSSYAGWKIHTIFLREDGFGGTLWVGRSNTNSSTWAIDKMPGCTQGGNAPTITYNVITGASSAPRICDITKIQYATGSWNNSVFVTLTDIYSGNISVKRYVDSGGTGLSEESAPFGGGAIAVYYPTKGGGDKDITVLKSTAIEKYDTSGQKTATILTDSQQQYIPSVAGDPRCAWMVVLPSS